MQSMCKVNGVSVTTGLQMCICTLWMHQWKRPLRGSLCFGFAARTAAPYLLSGTAQLTFCMTWDYSSGCVIFCSAPGDEKDRELKQSNQFWTKGNKRGGNTAVFRAACLQWFHNLWISLSCRHLQRAITQADSVFFFFFCGWFVCLFLNQEFTVRGINNILSIWVTWKNRGCYDQHGKKGTKCIHSSRITFLKTSPWEHKLVSGNETNLWCESDSEVWGTKIEAESCCDHKPAKSVNNMNQWLKTLRLPNLQLFTDFQSYCTAPILSDYTEK